MLSINARKIDSKPADINLKAESLLTYQVTKLREAAHAEPMTQETAILLNLIIEMVSEQRLVANTVIPKNKLHDRIESIKRKMVLVNRISNAVKDILPVN